MDGVDADLPQSAIPSVKEDGLRVLVVGIGGGGCTVVRRLSDDGLSAGDIDLALIDTDARMLESHGLEPVLRLGRSLTHGLGCGGDVSRGKCGRGSRGRRSVRFASFATD